MQLDRQRKRGDATTNLKSPNQTTNGTNLQNVNRCVEVEHSEIVFD
jgi:hypothetical protein